MNMSKQKELERIKRLEKENKYLRRELLRYEDKKSHINVENMVWTVKYRTLGYIGYDFISTRRLTPEALQKVEELFDEMADVDGRKRKSLLPVPGFGTSTKVRLEICRRYMPMLKDIVLDEDNWE